MQCLNDHRPIVFREYVAVNLDTKVTDRCSEMEKWKARGVEVLWRDAPAYWMTTVFLDGADVLILPRSCPQ